MRCRFLSLAVVLLLFACQGATDAQSHLVLTLSIDRTSLGVGDTSHLTLTLTNHSSKSMQVPPVYCGTLFTITDAAGRLFGPPPVFCAMMAGYFPPIDLAAGDSFTVSRSWAADSGAHPLRVDAGTYTLRGVLAGPEHPITSNAIAVQVQGFQGSN